MTTRIASLVATLLLAGIGTAAAQGPDTTQKPEVKAPDGQVIDQARPGEPAPTGSSVQPEDAGKVDKRIPFEGKVSTVNEGSREITINADSIPHQMGGQTTLPYTVPESIPFSTFKEGDVVHGDLVVRENRTFVENLKPGPMTKDGEGKTDKDFDKESKESKDKDAKKDVPN
jgi:hypothetical protein